MESRAPARGGHTVVLCRLAVGSGVCVWAEGAAGAVGTGGEGEEEGGADHGTRSRTGRF